METAAAPTSAKDGSADSKPIEDSVAFVINVFIGWAVWTVLRFLWTELRETRAKKRKAKTTATYGEIFLYRLGVYFANNRYAKPALLLHATFLLIAFGAVMLRLAMAEEGGALGSAAWEAWTYVADPGTHADAEGYLPRLVAVGITLGGMLIFALVIGLVSDEIAQMVDALDKGTSRCIEDDHTLMLGWTDKSLAIIQEIALANESEGGGVIVVLAEADKSEMEDTLLSALQMTEHPLRLLGTQVVFRSGNPLAENQLRKVSVLTARSIIALSPDGLSPDEADSRMVRQVLCIKSFQADPVFQGGPHVVVEMQDIDNKELVMRVAPDISEVIVAHDMIGRLMVQCAREPGLAYVLESLVGFEGSEFYFQAWPELEGLQFREITRRFDDAVPVGIKCGEDERILLNPENSYVIRPGDQVICIAEDNDSYTTNNASCRSPQQASNGGLEFTTASKPQTKEKLLFCGWRRDMHDMIEQLDRYVAKGSELWLFNSVPASERIERLSDKGNKAELNLQRLTMRNVVGSPLIRRDLKNLVAVDDSGRPIEGETVTLDSFDSILILADVQEHDEMQSTDSQSLVSLLIIQDIQRRQYKQQLETLDTRMPIAEDDSICETGGSTKVPCDPISEILDSRTRGLLKVADCKGYVMSNQIVSAVIAQVSEERMLNLILGELMSGRGSELLLKGVECYLSEEELEQMNNGIATIVGENDNNNNDKNTTEDTESSTTGGGRNSDANNRKAAKKKKKKKKKSKNSTASSQPPAINNEVAPPVRPPHSSGREGFSFWDIADRARSGREVVIGYIPKDKTPAEAKDTILNPVGKDVLRRWERGDKVIVLSRHYVKKQKMDRTSFQTFNTAKMKAGVLGIDSDHLP